MAIVVTDASSAIYNFLKTDAAAATTRALVHDGAANVFESGDITPALLAEIVDDRRTTGALTDILALDVEDAGEDARVVGQHHGMVRVRLYDRARGYRNLRSAREQLIEDLRDFNATLTDVDGNGRGLLEVRYAGRTGHRFDRAYALDWEAVQFETYVTIEEED